MFITHSPRGEAWATVGAEKAEKGPATIAHTIIANALTCNDFAEKRYIK